MPFYRSRGVASAALALGLALFPCVAHAEADQARGAAAAAKVSGRASRPPADVTSEHAIEVGGRRLVYSATAGFLPLRTGEGDITAHVFYVAYTAERAQRDRPVTFVFNGGPGAASAFLHIGALGPRVLAFAADGSAALRPLRLDNNPDTWLDMTDLVFVDPVGTGYSRTVKRTEEAERAYFGIEQDTDSVLAVMQLYLARSDRLKSPIFLAGESYGGFRAAVLIGRLQEAGIDVRGAVLVSPALEFAMLRSSSYILLPTALVLPSLAASHLEHVGGADAPLDLLPEVERFARTTYLVHLASGLRSDPDIDRALARYTGLPEDVIARHHSRITASTFLKEYRERSGRHLSAYDATVGTPAPANGRPRSDPVLGTAATALTEAFTEYAREELGLKTSLDYRLLHRTARRQWDFGGAPTRQGYAGSLDALHKARTRNPALGILIVHGYSDLVTPYSVSRFLIDQLAPVENARPIALAVYRGGHMMYFRPSSRAALAQDARSFYAGLAKARTGGPQN